MFLFYFKENKMFLSIFYVNIFMLKFIPVVERRVEARHAALKKDILRGRHFRGSYASLSVRLPEIQKRIDNDASVLHCLIKELQGVNHNPHKLMMSLGLHQHPQADLHKSSLAHRQAVDIVYQNEPVQHYGHEHGVHKQAICRQGQS